MSAQDAKRRTETQDRGGPASRRTIAIPLKALPVRGEGEEPCQPWFGEGDLIQQRVFLLNATFRCIRAAIELANAPDPAHLDDAKNVYKPEKHHCKGDLRIDQRVLSRAIPVRDPMDAAAIQKAFLTSWKVFSDGLRPLWMLLKLGDDFDRVETMVKHSTTLPKGYTLVHEMNFTNWTKRSVKFDEKWRGEFAMWWTPLLDAEDVGRHVTKTGDAMTLEVASADYVAMAKRPICGFLDIDAFEPSGGREKPAGGTRRTGFYELVTDYLNPICKPTEDDASKATFEPDGLLGKPMEDAYLTTESCWNVVNEVRGANGLGRDRTLPKLLEQAFSGWVLRYDPRSNLERQVVLFPRVRANDLFHTWKLGQRPIEVNVSDALQIHVAGVVKSNLFGGGRPWSSADLVYRQGLKALNASADELAFLPRKLKELTFPSVRRATMIRAARTGDTGSLVHLLETGPPETGFDMAFHEAASNGHADVVKVLLNDPGVGPRVRKEVNLNLVMHLAAFSGHADVVQASIEADVVTPKDRDSFVLRYAAQNGFTRVVEVLLADNRPEKRVVPSDVDSEALRLAAARGYDEIVELLLHLSNPSDMESEALRLAADHGYVRVVKLLLADTSEKRADPKAKQSATLRSLARDGNHELVMSLLQDGRAVPSDEESEALRLAAANGHDRVVELLLADTSEKRADPRARDNEALRMAASNGHTDVVRLLLEDGRADPTDRDYEAPRKAAVNGHVAVVNLFITKGLMDKEGYFVDDEYFSTLLKTALDAQNASFTK